MALVLRPTSLHCIRRTPRGTPFLPPLPEPQLPVGGRISNFFREWSSITKDSWVLSIVRDGYKIPFGEFPPTTSLPRFLMPQHSALHEVLVMLLEKGAVERVFVPSSPGFYSRLFLVPKKDGSWRPVIDLSSLNRFIVLDHFQMENTRSIRSSVKLQDWAVSLDLADAYFHILIHPQSWKFLRFTVGNQVFQFRVLPFGLSTAPRVFTKLMSVVGSHLRILGVSILQYFDDWLLHQGNRLSLNQSLLTSWTEIIRLGLMPNLPKSELIPSQIFVFVGMEFHTEEGTIHVPYPRVAALQLLVNRTIRKSSVTARFFLSLLGTLNSVADLVMLGRLHMRPLQIVLPT